MFPKSELHLIEKIATQYVALDRCGGDADLEVKVSELWVVDADKSMLFLPEHRPSRSDKE